MKSTTTNHVTEMTEEEKALAERDIADMKRKKNAERQRRYYQEHKEEINARRKANYDPSRQAVYAKHWWENRIKRELTEIMKNAKVN